MDVPFYFGSIIPSNNFSFTGLLPGFHFGMPMKEDGINFFSFLSKKKQTNKQKECAPVPFTALHGSLTSISYRVFTEFFFLFFFTRPESNNGPSGAD